MQLEGDRNSHAFARSTVRFHLLFIWWAPKKWITISFPPPFAQPCMTAFRAATSGVSLLSSVMYYCIHQRSLLGTACHQFRFCYSHAMVQCSNCWDHHSGLMFLFNHRPFGVQAAGIHILLWRISLALHTSATLGGITVPDQYLFPISPPIL